MEKTSLEELFSSIENSKLYKEYQQMVNILNKDSEIKTLIEEIKALEKKATYLENIGDASYKEIDNIIKEKANTLNNKQVYIEYLNKMSDFNQELSVSSKMISDYLSEKV
ncbi:MAG: YlbF family regulator [Mycoplasmatota bacterium]|nr:YlbF family regulator [Mycoplasmatota bacterium]